VSCGNHYLASYALQFNDAVFFNPTTIDTAYHMPENPNPKSNGTVTIGWTGSYSTLKYMKLIEPVLQQIEREFEHTRFVVIADEKPTLDLQRLSFVPWSLKSEIRDLQAFDIGVMPLPDDAWAPGKCGFKILQYLALEIPAVASPVGVNADIVQDGVTGFLCASPESWYAGLKKLIENENLRRSFGSRGREFVVTNYSVLSNTSNFLCLFR
jgi:glycosyltransferase involved in cell wall biosynthesis